MEKLYRIAGISRQAHYKAISRAKASQILFNEVNGRVEEIRQKHPRMGLKKVYHLLADCPVGRDKFIDWMMKAGHGVPPIRSFTRTTFSLKHIRFENLLSGKEFTGVNQAWVSDITYVRVGNRFYYLSLILDVFTRQIVGWAISDSLTVEGSLQALKMAITKLPRGKKKNLIHHSDRGTQYGSKEYQKLLSDNGIRISMGNKAWENAHAERINGILKQEYLDYYLDKRTSNINQQIKKVIYLYNQERPHGSLPGLKTPNGFNTDQIDNSKKNYTVKINY